MATFLRNVVVPNGLSYPCLPVWVDDGTGNPVPPPPPQVPVDPNTMTVAQLRVILIANSQLAITVNLLGKTALVALYITLGILTYP